MGRWGHTQRPWLLHCSVVARQAQAQAQAHPHTWPCPACGPGTRSSAARCPQPAARGGRVGREAAGCWVKPAACVGLHAATVQGRPVTQHTCACGLGYSRLSVVAWNRPTCELNPSCTTCTWATARGGPGRPARQPCRDPPGRAQVQGCSGRRAASPHPTPRAASTNSLKMPPPSTPASSSPCASMNCGQCGSGASEGQGGRVEEVRQQQCRAGLCPEARSHPHLDADATMQAFAQPI